MASIFLQKTRHVLPNFRSFADTVALGEVSSPSLASVYAVPVDFDSLVTEWKRAPSVGVAGDIVSSALVSGA